MKGPGQAARPTPAAGPSDVPSVGDVPLTGAPATVYRLIAHLAAAAGPGPQQALRNCLDLPGVEADRVGDGAPPTFRVRVMGPQAAAALESCSTRVPLYDLELASGPETGRLGEAELSALRQRVQDEADGLRDELKAAGVVVAGFGPEPARGLLQINVVGDLTIADRLLRQRYGDDVVIALAPGLGQPG